MGVLLSKTLLSWKEPLVVAVVHREEAARDRRAFGVVLRVAVFAPLLALAWLLFLRERSWAWDGYTWKVIGGTLAVALVLVELAEIARRNFARAVSGNRIFFQEDGIAAILDGGLPVTWAWDQITHFNFDVSLTTPSVLILNLHLPGDRVLQFGVDPAYTHEQVAEFLQSRGVVYHDRRMEEEAEAIARAEAVAAAAHSRLVPSRAFDPDLAYAQRIGIGAGGGVG